MRTHGASSAEDAIACKILGKHAESQEDLASGLRLQLETVARGRDELLVLEARTATEEETCVRTHTQCQRRVSRA